jgi:RimJ/RimL family protein N-acetyltransferase
LYNAEVDPILAAAPAPRPSRIRLEGRLVDIEPLDPARHADSLWDAVRDPEHDGLWAYLFDGPFGDARSFRESVERKAASEDPLFFAIVDRATGRATGYAAYLRIEPAHRVIEVGGILFTPLLQRTRGATEAMFLMARHAFDELGYRRYEWKCDSRNQPSRRAAERLGFTFEGVFRQHMIIKGRNRDTAWYSMLDSEWPARKAAFERWLAPSNFDEQGRQRTPLRAAP